MNRGGRRALGSFHGQRNGGSYVARNFRSRSPPLARSFFRTVNDWPMWPEVTVRVSGLPPDASTINVYEMLNAEGNISKIDLLESDGSRTGEALVTFCPPPDRAFWNLDDWEIELEEEAGQKFPLQIILKDRRRGFAHRSPVNPSKFYPEKLVLHPETMDIGFMYQRDEMMVMKSLTTSDQGNINILLNLARREVIFEFSIISPDSSLPKNTYYTERIKFHIPFHQLDTIWEMDDKNSKKSLVISLDKPPAFHRKLHAVDLSFNDGKHWNERFRWTRMTEIKQLREQGDEKPLKLRKSDHIIDIGRWTTYRFAFDLTKLNRATYDQVKEVLKDYNVRFLHPGIFKTIPRTLSNFWDSIDLPESSGSEKESFLLLMASETRHLAWPVRYQLEGCISHGCINERNITQEFINRLDAMSEDEALARLEAIADQKKRVFNPMEILETPIPRTKFSKKIPKHCLLQRSATVTPSTIYFNPRSVEMSNRVLRQYREHSDRFLRVRFTDEKFEGRIHATDDDTQDAVFTRVYNCLTKGIIIGDRHFEFLAMGNSQFREHGAYFFASTPTLTAATMREQLGKIGKMQNDLFVPEKVVAKYASRLGQCFSTTHAIRGMKLKIIEIADVERNGYTFTDGVGKISSFVAQMIATELNLRENFVEAPSLFQFRMGGIKGVVAVCPHVKGHEIHIRGSQYKFAAIYEGLEIIRWSSYTVPRLNRQLITVMRNLRIPDKVFLDKMTNELDRLDRAMRDDTIALAMLQEQIDYNQTTLTIANIMHDGFMQVRDPFAMSIVSLWRTWSTKQLKEKAALTVPEGAFLLGCTDETGTLKGYFKDACAAGSIEDCIQSLPEIFVQITDPQQRGAYKIIEDVCIVARNPSLHPGDIRVVKAVNAPALHHLKNVVVFPQTGDRDIPNMCSGGDLDGDDFVVIWDKDLIPPVSEWNVPAMDFTGPKPKEVEKVTLNDLVSFFVIYMKTDTLRTIATSHLANADQLPLGVRHPRCLELANQHSIAVDYPKSGIPADPIHKLRPSKYPHFMTNRHRPKDREYHSETVLGKLYDAVPSADFRPMIHYSFDSRVLDAFALDDSLLEAAAEVKSEYDAAMRRIMAQHEINTEFEVWSTFVMSHAQLSNDYKFHEEIGRMSNSLKEQFIEICHTRAGGKDYDTIAPFVAAMYTVTANESANALETHRRRGLDDISPSDLPFISFPWLFHRELGKIARGPRAAASESIVAQQAATRRKRAPKAFDLSDLIDLSDEYDKVETEEGGVTHRGDLLALPLKSPIEQTSRWEQHRRQANDSNYTGPQLDEIAAKVGAFKLESLDYDDISMKEDDLEEGEITAEPSQTPLDNMVNVQLATESAAKSSGDNDPEQSAWKSISFERNLSYGKEDKAPMKDNYAWTPPYRYQTPPQAKFSTPAEAEAWTTPREHGWTASSPGNWTPPNEEAPASPLYAKSRPILAESKEHHHDDPMANTDEDTYMADKRDGEAVEEQVTIDDGDGPTALDKLDEILCR